MRVVIQTKLDGVYETIWSAEMLTRSGKPRRRKVFEGMALTGLLAEAFPTRKFQVGVTEDKKAGFSLILGKDLVGETRRAVLFATRGHEAVE